MAVDEYGPGAELNGEIDLVEKSYLSYIIPKATNLDLEEASQDVDDTGALFDTIEQRQSLFFDETVDVHLILRTPLVDEAALRSYLTRLRISLEARVVVGNGNGSERADGPPTSETIFEDVVEQTDDPFIVVDASEDSESDGDSNGDGDGDGVSTRQTPHIYAVWKMPVFLARPRIRLQHPSVVFRASASLGPASSSSSSPSPGPTSASQVGNDTGHGNSVEKSGYMRSGVPSGLNLLESIGGDPFLGGVTPRLSALRVSRVAPVTQSKDLMQPIRAQAGLELAVFPAIHTRVRFSRPNTSPPTAALIALLEIDLTPHFRCDATLDSISLSAPDTTIQDLNATQTGLTLPLKCSTQDHITLLYRLAPHNHHQLDTNPSSTKLPSRELSIQIKATIQAQPGLCTPHLSLSWTTTLDFTPPVNPSYGFGSTQQPIRRAHRPSQLSISGGDATQSLTAPSVSRPDALPALEAATRTTTETTIPDLGLTMTFCAPKGVIYPGEPFCWDIHVVNRTSESSSSATATATATTTTPNHPGRKLALVTIPRRRRPEPRPTRPPSTSAGGKKSSDGRKLADAVVDENVVYALQRAAAQEGVEIVSLSADTRVGPLAPGACHVAEMKLVALRSGVLGLEAVRVVDLGTQEHVDVRELPVVIVSEK